MCKTTSPKGQEKIAVTDRRERAGTQSCPFRAAKWFVCLATQGGGEYALPWARSCAPSGRKTTKFMIQSQFETVYGISDLFGNSKIVIPAKAGV